MNTRPYASLASLEPGDALLVVCVPSVPPLRGRDAPGAVRSAPSQPGRVPKEKDAHNTPSDVRWVTYSYVVYHAAGEDLVPLCGAPSMPQRGTRWCLEINGHILRRLLVHRGCHLCRACSRIVADRPAWADE